MARIQLLIFDDSNSSFPEWSNVVLSDPDAAKYVAGVAIHKYTNESVSPTALDQVHESYPNKFILNTQTCAGSDAKPEDKVILGSWERAEEYASNIIEDFNHWVNGFIDWNLALNTEGTPSWAGHFLDSPIIVNATGQEFYKQPMYYALGQFSKFLPVSSARVESHLEQAHSQDTTETNLQYTAFYTQYSGIVVIVLNKDDKKYNLKIKDLYREGSVQKVINERSITTFVQEYERHGIPIWGLTTQNEPTTGFVPGFRWQTLGFSAKSQRDFVKLDLGPALAEAGYGVDKLQLMVLDDSRLVLPHWTNVVLGDPEAAKYVSGVAVHWYTDNITDPRVLDKVHESFPNKFILGTEACTGSANAEDKVKLGSWERAELYAADIPPAKHFRGAPLGLTHNCSSRVLRTARNTNSTKLEYAAFKTPDSSLVVIVLHRDDDKVTLKIKGHVRNR
ncbi:hypothetical protein MTO96_022123 [Rhipicephalus appendiculatus]